MGNDRDGYAIRRNSQGGPVLLVFDATAAEGETFEHAGLWDRIVDDRGPSCGLVLLRDAKEAGYYRGVAGLGDSIDETAASLRAIIARFQATEVITCGAALGGHAALMFGALLGASRVVAVEPVAHLIADELERYNDRRWRNVLAALPEPSLAQRFDALDAMTRCRFGGDAFILFGTGRGNETDQAAHLNLVHAQWLARSDRVALCPFPGVWQDLWGVLERRGDLAEVMRRYLFEEQIQRREARKKPAPSGAPVMRAKPCVASLVRDVGEADSQKIEILYAIAGNGEAPEVRKVDDEMHRWIAENLLLGHPPRSIAERMKTIGISERVALHEIRQASESPYLRAALRLQNRLKKRDWLLSVYGKLGRLHPGSEHLDRRRRLSRDDFFRDYYTLNRPVAIEGMIDDWPARSRWNLDDFDRRFGDRTVQIRVRLNESDQDVLFRANATQVVTFAEYTRMIRRAGKVGDFCLTTDDDDNQSVLSGLWDDVGRLPEYLDDTSSQAGAFRLDPAGAITPFRHEFKNVLLALVMGRLRVRIVPSHDLSSMRNAWQNRSELDGRQMFAVTPDRCDQPQVLECILEPGDLLFLPVGCWYFVETIEIAATLNFTHFIFDNEFSVPDIADGVL